MCYISYLPGRKCMKIPSHLSVCSSLAGYAYCMFIRGLFFSISFSVLSVNMVINYLSVKWFTDSSDPAEPASSSGLTSLTAAVTRSSPRSGILSHACQHSVNHKHQTQRIYHQHHGDHMDSFRKVILPSNRFGYILHIWC